MRKLCALLACGCIGVLWAKAQADDIHVAAAISMKESLEAAATAFQKAGGDTVHFNFGSSGAMVAQIKSGGDEDAFISAADKQMDDLDAAKLIDAATRRVVATNELVIVVPTDAKATPADFRALTDPAYKKIALGEPTTVPAGMYAQEVLVHLKLTDELAGRLVYGANVRQVLVYVEHGEVEAGIVYRTDAKEAANTVKLAATADAHDHAPIEYPGAVLSSSAHKKSAIAFLNFLGSDAGKTILLEKGFGVPALNGDKVTTP
jgi:molybdate transport system substrate-binding protein